MERITYESSSQQSQANDASHELAKHPVNLPGQSSAVSAASIAKQGESAIDQSRKHNAVCDARPHRNPSYSSMFLDLGGY